MATYIYEAYNKQNEVTHGQYEGNTETEVIDFLNKRYLTPISVKLIGGEDKEKNILSIQLFDKIGSVDVMFLVRNLATTIKAGLSIVESLDILIEDTNKKMMKKILQGVQAMIKNGQLLSYSFNVYKDSFPAIFIGMIKAGEVSGKLDKTLSELASYLSKEYALRSKVKSALTYPIILLVSSFGVVVLMLIFVLPRLTKAFTSSGVSLPWITKFFMNLSAVLTWSFTLDFVVFLLLVWFFFYFRTTQIGKKFFFWIASHTPVAKDLIKRIAIIRFTRTFGNLIDGGLSVVDALELSAQSVGNNMYKFAIDAAIADIKNGIPISEALGKFPKLFPRLLISLVAVGERTGSLHEILQTFSDFYEEEVDNKLKDLTSVLEPVLLLIMGLMVGSIAVAIIIPIYQLVGHFV
ncbi:MAG: type II secretion system F family protein [bacterium]